MTNEVWKSVLGFEGLYEVSSLGRVRALSRIVPHVGTSTRQLPERLLQAAISSIKTGKLRRQESV